MNCHTEIGTYGQLFKKGVLRKILRSEWDEVTGDWRRLHSEELHDFYSLTEYYLGDRL
jgi:hypothetical protein